MTQKRQMVSFDWVVKPIEPPILPPINFLGYKWAGENNIFGTQPGIPWLLSHWPHVLTFNAAKIFQLPSDLSITWDKKLRSTAGTTLNKWSVILLFFFFSLLLLLFFHYIATLLLQDRRRSQNFYYSVESSRYWFRRS
jgi:hypothetical protein